LDGIRIDCTVAVVEMPQVFVEVSQSAGRAVIPAARTYKETAMALYPVLHCR
jgi:protein-L-isoaspartate O-methyltransferase